MKLFCVLLLVLFSPSIFANDGTYVTQVIHDTDPAYSFVVPAHKFIKITNFIQEGQNMTGPGGTEINGELLVFQGPQGLSGARVLYSSQAETTHQLHEDVFLSGVVVYVAPVPGLTLVLTYLRVSN